MVSGLESLQGWWDDRKIRDRASVDQGPVDREKLWRVCTRFFSDLRSCFNFRGARAFAEVLHVFFEYARGVRSQPYNLFECYSVL